MSFTPTRSLEAAVIGALRAVKLALPSGNRCQLGLPH
jgi:hypothetical protein